MSLPGTAVAAECCRVVLSLLGCEARGLWFMVG